MVAQALNLSTPEAEVDNICGFENSLFLMSSRSERVRWWDPFSKQNKAKQNILKSNQANESLKQGKV